MANARKKARARSQATSRRPARKAGGNWTWIIAIVSVVAGVFAAQWGLRMQREAREQEQVEQLLKETPEAEVLQIGEGETLPGDQMDPELPEVYRVGEVERTNETRRP